MAPPEALEPDTPGHGDLLYIQSNPPLHIGMARGLRELMYGWLHEHLP